MKTEDCISNNSPEAELPDRFKRLFESCGINPDEVAPRPLGRGGNHEVYKSVDGERVVKVPINRHIGTVGSANEERLNINLYQQYFPNFSVPTLFLDSPLGYCVVMDFVNGRIVTKDDIFEAGHHGLVQLSTLGEQLEEIVENNRRLIIEKGRMIDLVGLQGLASAIGGLLPSGQPARLTNLLVEGERLRIVDYDLISLNLRNPFERLKYAFALQLNQQTLWHHFSMHYVDDRKRRL